MRVTNTETNNQFAVGFVSALVLLAVLAVGFEVGTWLLSHPFPAALIEILTKPMFSVFDLFQMTVFLLILWATITMLAVGGRRF